MIMEGISVVALHHLPCGDPSRSEAIDDCERAATQIWAPTGAICAMCAQAAGNGRRHRPRRNHRRGAGYALRGSRLEGMRIAKRRPWGVGGADSHVYRAGSGHHKGGQAV